ncbi:MAG TPA: MBL fold metallo-hydrolase [Caulobacteraceae bacterium]|jgi:glyoxylase-like metal-dependent hydrolase (beta-lactamase superfamily II)
MTAIPYVRDFAFEYGRADRVSPLIERVVANNPGPFTFTGTGTYIVGRGEPGATVAVIDPGPPLDEHLRALLAAVDGRRVSHVLVTHTHRDHSPLARPFAEAVGAEVVGCAAPQPVESETVVEEGQDWDYRPDRVLGDGETVTGDGWTLATLATPGHAGNHLCFALKEEQALFSGDHVMGWSTTVVAPPDGDMGAYMASLERIAARGFTTLWPTHGPPVTEVAPFLEAYRDHRLEREAQVLARLAAGDTTIAQMVPTLYAAVDRRLWPAASLSVLAHLEWLAAKGAVSREGEGLAAAWRLT